VRSSSLNRDSYGDECTESCEPVRSSPMVLRLQLPLKWDAPSVPPGTPRPHTDFIGPEAGYRLAALTDGEGCFSISTGHCAYIVKLRADDEPFLERMRTEIGSPGRIRRVVGTRGNQSPQSQWIVSRRGEVLWLTEIFDVYTPWSKKANDYAVWREAVIAWYSGDTDLEPFRVRIRAAREYRELSPLRLDLV
jgi:hypothetical protein